MKDQEINRRNFLAGAGATAAAVAFTIASPQTAKTYAANEKISLGLIGCGGRGGWIANLFKANGGYDIVGCADYFQGRVDGVGNAHNIPAANRYTGLSCYKKLLEQKNIDAVAIISPPYFHPEQAAAAVEAGKHVYLAKPIAVDVPGCKTIGASGKSATDKNLCFLVDFQTRVDQYYTEAVKRVHAGALGKIAFGESTYHAGSPWGHMDAVVAKDPANPENRLRAWGLDKVLSGDIITEQNIHTLDVMSWIMNSEPVSAVGTGGKSIRTHVGDCWDHFVLTYKYANDVGISFSSRQFKAHGTRPEGIRNRMFGSKGTLETEYGGLTRILGSRENYYKGGKSPSIYRDGAVTNIANFRKSIAGGDFANSTVDPSVRSNLVTILGRMAAYQGRTVTWAEMLRNDTKLDPKLDMKRLKA
jgi:myo-inositol 2-dehydrogenase/D-chiro-inositol 1-dehydrogenase